MTRDYFKTLTSLWKRDTLILSSVQQMAEHPCYQAIIADGWGAMPWIMEDMRDNGPNHWFVALVTITGKDVAFGEDTVRGACDKWLAWGYAVGLLRGE